MVILPSFVFCPKSQNGEFKGHFGENVRSSSSTKLHQKHARITTQCGEEAGGFQTSRKLKSLLQMYFLSAKLFRAI